MVITSSLHPSAPGCIDGGGREGMENLVLTSQRSNFLLCFLNVFTGGPKSLTDVGRLMLPEAAVSLRERV